MTKLLTCLLVAASVFSNGISAGPTSAPAYKLSFNKLRGENFEKAKSSGHKDSGYAEFNLHNQQDFYSVELQVGTPAQKVVVLLDTGSSDLWVTGDGNPYCSPKTRHAHLENASASVDAEADSTANFPGVSATIDCSQYGTFNSKDSETFKSNDSTFLLKYGDGSFSKGLWGTDTLHLDGLDISDISFAVANETNSSVGVFGIGLPGDEATVTPGVDGNHYQYKNFPQVLKDNGVIHKVAYSLYLDSPKSSGGNILFGAVDHSKYSGKLYTLPMVNTAANDVPLRRFDITVQGISVSNSSSNSSSNSNSSKTITSSKVVALLDSGTTLMYLPVELADNLAHSLGAKFSSSNGYYVLPKPSNYDLANTKINFDFGGFHIKTSLSNYILDIPDQQDLAVLGILRTERNTAILGDVFLTDAYVVYNLEDHEISLAQANFNSARASDIQAISTTVPGASRAPGYSLAYASQEQNALQDAYKEYKRQELTVSNDGAHLPRAYTPLVLSALLNIILISILF